MAMELAIARHRRARILLLAVLFYYSRFNSKLFLFPTELFSNFVSVILFFSRLLLKCLFRNAYGRRGVGVNSSCNVTRRHRL